MASAAAAAMLFCSCTEQVPGQVKVEGGLIQGTVTETMSIYKGIPFAAPPVGDLRWKAPQPVIPWDGVLETTEFAPAAMQSGRGNYSEDCLYLNIWTPAKSAKERIPVFVWIYGGGFAGGATSDPLFDGEVFAENGVVYVTIPYRLGKLGFLAHPELSAENEHNVSGNYGIQDLIAALQWIHNNIAKFGGDPDKVTIFGESAGGIAVSMLCASPLTKGLISGAISESGGSFGPNRPTTYPGENMKLLSDAENDGLAIMNGLGCSSIDEMRALPAEKFVERGLAAGGGWPIVDGYVIPDDQFVMYENGNYNDIPVLIGYNSDEGASFSGEKDPAKHIESVQSRYGQFADALLEVYPVTETSVPKSARDLMRDAAFGWQTWAWARLQTETGKSPAYLYYFDQHPEYPEDSPRAGYESPHGSEMEYVFHKINENKQNDPVEKGLENLIFTYWVNFAKYGNPNGEGLPQWDDFSVAKQTMLLKGDESRMIDVPSEKAMWVLDSYFAWRRSPEGKAWAK